MHADTRRIIASPLRRIMPAALSLGLVFPTLAAPPHLLAQTAAADNGIVVGQAKLYDERSLESLLGAIQNGIAGQNNATVNFINPAAVASHEGAVQGGESSSNSLTAAIDQTSAFGSGSSPASGSSSGGSHSGAGAAPAVQAAPAARAAAALRQGRAARRAPPTRK